MAAVATGPEHVDATIDYLTPSSRVNRRYVAPGAELSTGVYAPYPVRIHNGRCADKPFTLDEHGFCLARFPSALKDMLDRDEVEGPYAQEVFAIAKALTGADLVLPLGGMARSSRATRQLQPPATEAHVDMNTPTAQALARDLHSRAFPEGPGYDRFILFSLWRCLSPGPQDWPLALCDFKSARDDVDVPNVLVNVDAIPELDQLSAPINCEEMLPAASIFHHNPAHQWWYFSDMTRDEVVFITLHDSDHGRAWRCLHTAFHDDKTPGTIARESLEYRACAYFLRDKG